MRNSQFAIRDGLGRVKVPFSFRLPPSAFRPSTFSLKSQASGLQPGLSLVELLIAIGILAVSMMLIAAAFPAGVAMSIAVSDETTSQSVFQEALAVIQDNYSVAHITADSGTLAPTANYDLIPDEYLGQVSGSYNEAQGLANRQYGESGIFSWSALIRRSATAGAMGNLCHVIVVVSRQPSGTGSFDDNDGNATTSPIPELCSVNCTGTAGERTLTINANPERMPNTGYIIGGDTGAVYSIISRNEGTPDDTVTLLTAPPTGVNQDFLVIPGEYDSTDDTYVRVSPAVRVFQTTLYLP